MIILRKKPKSLFALLFISSLFVGAILPAIQAVDTLQIKGFDKGPSYKSVVPIKKASFVGYDDKTLLDDYAYLAAIPTAVFKDKYSDTIFSNPLLF
jgi:hypothetical protein